MARFIPALVLLLISCIPCYLTQLLDTYPKLADGEDTISVVVPENASSSSIYCAISSGLTTWLINGNAVVFNSTTGVGTDMYSYLSVSNGTNNANLTVNGDFSDHTMRFEIQCSSNITNEMVTFIFGMRTGPILRTPNSTYTVIEGDSFSIDLKYVTPFPPNEFTSLALTWWLNGSAINDSRIMQGEYNLSITAVWRGLHEAELTLNATSYDAKSFKLLVNFPVEADTIFNNSIVYQETGRPVNLVAVQGLRGRPSPMFQWFYPNGTEIRADIDANINFPTSGRLTIVSIEDSSFGEYTYNASNGIGNELIVKVQLKKATRPGAPLNVNVTSIEDESAIVTWSPPSNLGAPPLGMYSLQLSPNPDNSVFETEDNSTMYQLLRLIPGTSYSVNVSGVSDFDFMYGNPVSSDLVSFKTSLGVPRIDSNTVIKLMNGQLFLAYSLKHTGGYDPELVQLSASCGPTGSFQLPTITVIVAMMAGSGQQSYPDINSPYEGECSMNCFDNQLQGEMEVDTKGPLTAGDSYICAVSAQNMEGIFYYNTTSVTSETGIPAEPIVTVTVNAGNIMVTFMSSYPGVDQGDTSFSFTVVIRNGTMDGVVKYKMTFNGTNERTVTIELPVGVYFVNVFSQNSYGTSSVFSQEANVQMELPSSSPTIEEEDNKLPLEAIVGIALGGTVLVFAVFITIVIIALCVYFYRQKKGSVDFYRSKYEMTIKRY